MPRRPLDSSYDLKRLVVLPVIDLNEVDSGSSGRNVLRYLRELFPLYVDGRVEESADTPEDQRRQDGRGQHDQRQLIRVDEGHDHAGAEDEDIADDVAKGLGGCGLEFSCLPGRDMLAGNLFTLEEEKGRKPGRGRERMRQELG